MDVLPHKNDSRPNPKKESQDALVKVYTTGREDNSALAKSMLRSADIEFMVRNDYLQGLFGYGNLFGNPLTAIGGIEFWVRREDADDAIEILSALDR